MISHASDDLGDSVDISGDTAKIGVELRAPTRRDHRFTLLGTEDDVVMQREVRGWHDWAGWNFWHPSGVHPTFVQWSRWLTPPANFYRPSGAEISSVRGNALTKNLNSAAQGNRRQ